MKTVLLKDNHESGATTLAHPLAKPGIVRTEPGLVTIKEIRNVPDDFPLAKLAMLWNRTCDCTWLKNWNEKLGTHVGRYSFDFAELGEGKIILR